MRSHARASSGTCDGSPVVETEEKIQEVLPELDGMIGGGLITLERARVILYRPAEAVNDARSRHRVEGLEPEDS